MAIKDHQFGALDAVLPSSNAAGIVVNDGTNFPIPALAFAGGSTDENAYFIFSASDYDSGSPTCDIYWYADTATSGVVRWGCAISSYTPNDDAGSIENASFLSVSETNDTHLESAGKRLHKVTITIGSVGDLAADDFCVVRLYRKASDTSNDTMSGDALVPLFVVSYSDG